jgi:3-hydroxyisobutyrate dehydrogenase-like beta-hydroxyacid dehydrogenase
LTDVHWGIIGFGEVGSIFAYQLSRSGASVHVTDPILAIAPLPPSVPARIDGEQVQTVSDVPGLVRVSNVTLSLVTPDAAAGVAHDAGPVSSESVFVDFNSISPGEKRRLAQLFPEGCYVDGAIMGSIAAEKAQTPLVLSGAAAQTVTHQLNEVGFNASMLDGGVGAASALKMSRSIFMKGVECLFLETVLAADEFGIRDRVLQSIEETFLTLGFSGTVDMLLTTHAVHCGRRSREMAKVVEMLAEACLPNNMSSAARDLLIVSAESGLTEHVLGQVSTTPDVVTTYLANFYQERR